VAPAGASKRIIDRLAKEVARAVRDPKIAQRFANFGVDPLGNTPEEFAAQIAADIALCGRKRSKLPARRRNNSTLRAAAAENGRSASEIACGVLGNKGIPPIATRV